MFRTRLTAELSHYVDNIGPEGEESQEQEPLASRPGPGPTEEPEIGIAMEIDVEFEADVESERSTPMQQDNSNSNSNSNTRFVGVDHVGDGIRNSESDEDIQTEYQNVTSELFRHLPSVRCQVN